MNNVTLVGYIQEKPKMQDLKRVTYIDFKLMVSTESEKNASRLSPLNYILVNCRAYDDLAKYIYRNCLRGTLIEVKGSLGTRIMNSEVEKKTYNFNYVYVEDAKVLTKREIAIEDFDDYIKKFSNASFKKQIQDIIKESDK